MMEKTRRIIQLSLRVEPGRRAFAEELRREYSASVEKLAPLIARIGETERLIDRLVYRL
jgi:hypothetical protein